MTLTSNGECKSCHAKVCWTVTPTGAKSPIDVEPDTARGNVLLLKSAAMGSEILSVVLSGQALVEARRSPAPLFLSHWATCPDKAEWRAKQDAKLAAAA